MTLTFATCSEAILDSTLFVEHLPSSAPIHVSDINRLSSEQLIAILEAAMVSPDQAWQQENFLERICTFQVFDPETYPGSLNRALETLGIAPTLAIGTDQEKRSYLFLSINEQQSLLTRPISMEHGECRFEDPKTIDDILFREKAVTRTPGGKGMNATLGLAALGYKCLYYGRVGADNYGKQYAETAIDSGVTVHLEKDSKYPSGHCLCMITPDGERTMLTHLGAAAQFKTAHLKEEWFSELDHYHSEGYRILEPNFVETSFEFAKKNGATTSLELGSEFVVKNKRADLMDVIRSKKIDVLVGNLGEMQALTSLKDPVQICNQLGEYCETVVVTLGGDGSMIKKGEEGPLLRKIEPVSKVVDLTGAGDLYLAGLLHGIKLGLPAKKCAKFGAIMAAGTIISTGAQIRDFSRVKERLEQVIQKSICS